MRVVKVYRPPGQTAPVDAFLKSLEKKLRDKIVWQIFTLARLDKTEMREPHFKHFSLERYSQLYEIREKGTVLVRIVYTICGGDIILLIPFVKRQKRDTEKALEQSLKKLAELREHPEYAAEFNFMEVTQ